VAGIVAIGIDGSPSSDAALAWAAEEARIRDARLRLLHAYHAPPTVPGALPPSADDLRRSALDLLDAAVERVHASVGVEREAVAVLRGNVAQALIDGSKDADLLVVGTRGLGGFSGLLMGSVSQQCVGHAHCPVVVIPQPEA
jgi:nucleotide-binding universal stress UspA family protein